MSAAREPLPPAVPHEAHVVVPRTARYFTVGTRDGAREVWVALHGYGQLASYFARHFAPHADGRLFVVPEALSRFYLAGTGGPSTRVGATWMTREDRLHEIDDYVRYLDLVLDAAAGRDLGEARLCVLGFSQGATTACRWLARRRADGRVPASRLVLWGGGVPHDLDLRGDGAVLRELPLTLVVGDADEFVTPQAIADQQAHLRNAGVPFEAIGYEGGHRIVPEVLAALLG